MRCLNASVKLTGRQPLEQVGTPVPNGNSIRNACVARPGVLNSLIGFISNVWPLH